MQEITPSDKLEWSTPAFEYREKSKEWYVVVSIVAISLAITSVLLHNVIFAIVIILGVGLMMYYSKLQPETVHISFDGSKMSVDDKDYPYLNIDSFWVETRFGRPRIIIVLRHKLSTQKVLPIGEQDPDYVRHFLGYHLDEEEHSEPFLTHTFERLGF